jgi:hypothetical protein
LTRGREALKRRLAAYVRDVGPELGLIDLDEPECESQCDMSGSGEGLEVTS